MQLVFTTASSESLRSFLPKHLFRGPRQSNPCFLSTCSFPSLRQVCFALPLGEFVWLNTYHVLPLSRKPQGSHSQMCTRHDFKSLCNFQVPLTVLSGFPFQLYLFVLSHLLPHAAHLAFRWLCIWHLPRFPSINMAREGNADYSFRHLLGEKIFLRN